jgi:hypothetical protein
MSLSSGIPPDLQIEGNPLVIIRVKTMLENNDETELDKSEQERQPWEPPTEAETEKAVEEVLAQHLTPVEGNADEKPEPNGNAIPEGGQKQEEAPVTTEEVAPGETKEEEEVLEIPTPIQAPVLEQKPGRLERRIAKLYTRNLTLSEQEAPDVEEVLAELTSGKYSFDQKMAMLHLHRKENKQLRGVDVRVREDDEDEDAEILKESEREQIRYEIQQEEYQKSVEKNFVGFIGSHPELDEDKTEYNPILARAVETLWRGGMSISDAYDTVTNQIEAVKAEQANNDVRDKQRALSGTVTASSQAVAPKDENEYTWTEFNQLMQDDPTKWQKLIESGYEPKG